MPGSSPPTRSRPAATPSSTITYTAGKFGIDDTGAIKICWRTASDAAKPQFSDPKAPNYTTATASNGAALELEYNRNNIRPWVNTLFIRVGRGFLRAGDRIVVRLGDRAHGSPGYRLQTAREKPFWFKIFVDAFSTYDFVELPDSPTLELVPGPVVRWKAILPTLVRAGEPFRLAVVGEDRWGNPSEQADAVLRLVADRPVEGLPPTLEVRGGNGTAVVEGLRATEPGELRIDLQGRDGRQLVRSNPLRIVAEPGVWPLLGRPARPERRDRRHRHGRRVLPVRARQGVHRHRRPPGQRLPDRHRALGRDQPRRRRARRARPLRRAARLRVVRQHRHGRRSQRVLPRPGPADLPLLARAARRGPRRRQRLPPGRRAVREAGRRERRGDRPCRRPLRRSACRPRRPFRARGRGALLLGHLRVAAARRVRPRPSRRRGLPQRRPQGPARRRLAGRRPVRRDRRSHLLPDAEARPRRAVRDPAPPPPLRHDRHAALSRRPGPAARRRPAVRRRPEARPDRRAHPPRAP